MYASFLGPHVHLHDSCVYFRQGNRQPTAFTGPFGESMFPVLSVQQGVGARVNLGGEPFMLPLPEGYLPVEDPTRVASSWLARFEHAGDVTEAVFTQTQLPDAVIDMTFASEDASADAKPLPMLYHSKSGSGFAHQDLSRLVAGVCFPVLSFVCFLAFLLCLITRAVKCA